MKDFLQNTFWLLKIYMYCIWLYITSLVLTISKGTCPQILNVFNNQEIYFPWCCSDSSAQAWIALLLPVLDDFIDVYWCEELITV